MGRFRPTPLVIVLAFLLAQAPLTAPRLHARLDEPAACPSFSSTGASLGMALLLQFVADIPEPTAGEDRLAWALRLGEALTVFKDRVAARYSEGTLQRLCESDDEQVRRAAVLALGLIGSMSSNQLVAEALYDEDPRVRQLAGDALWAIWFRADSERNNAELQRLLRLGDASAAKAGYAALLKKAPRFAEAYNQRAILHYRLGDFQQSIADCERTLQLNPLHFGAQAGLAQGYLKIRKPKAALKAFRRALQVNPNLEGVEQSVRALEQLLGEEEKSDDKK